MSGKVVDVVRFADYPIVSGTIVAMVVWGYRMWWLRRPTRAHVLRFGRPARRGAWREIPLAAVVALLALAVGVGLFLPLFGVMLAIFVVVDLVIGLYRWRKVAEPVEQAESEELLV